MPENLPSVVLFGDPVIHSDVGNFCRRLVDSSRQGQIAHFCPSARNLFSCDVSLLLPPWRGSVCSNIVNNRNLAFNHLATVYCSLRVSHLGVSPPPLLSIVHDPCLHQVTQYIIQAWRDGMRARPWPRSLSSNEDFSAYCSILLFNEVLPSSVRERFLSLRPAVQAEYLLGSILVYYDAVLCHSLAAEKLVRRSLELVESCRDIHVKPLPYDCPVAARKPDLPSLALAPARAECAREKISIALYGISVDTSFDLNLLCLFVAELACSYDVNVAVAGKNNELAISLLHDLAMKTDSLSVEYLGFISDQELVELLGMVDYVWAYRNVASGESSGTVLKALSCGACPVVAAHGAYLELPAELVLMLPPRLETFEDLDVISLHLSASIDRNRRLLYVRDGHSPRDYLDFLRKLASDLSPPRSVCSQSLNTPTGEGLFGPSSSTVLGYRCSMLFELHRHEFTIASTENEIPPAELIDFVRCSLSHMPIPPEFATYPCYSLLPVVLFPGYRHRLESLVASRLTLFVDVLVDQLLGLVSGHLGEFSPMPHLFLRSKVDPYCLTEDSSLYVQQEFERCVDHVLQRVNGRDDQLAVLLPVVFAMLFSEMLAPLVNSMLCNDRRQDIYPIWASFSHAACVRLQSSPLFREGSRGFAAYASDLLLRFYNWHCCLAVSFQALHARRTSLAKA